MDNNIEKLRKRLGWSMEELAEACSPKTTASQINKLEKGQRELDAMWIVRLCKALGARPDEVVPAFRSFYTPDMIELFDDLASIQEKKRDLKGRISRIKSGKENL